MWMQSELRAATAKLVKIPAPPFTPFISQPQAPPPPQGGGRPGYYNENREWISTDEEGNPVDDAGNLLDVGEDVSFEFTDENGKKTYVTATEARILAEALLSGSSATAHRLVSVVDSTKTQRTSAGSRKLRTSAHVRKSHTTASSPRAGIVIPSKKPRGDGDDEI